MPQTDFNPVPEPEVRFQCRHIFTAGHRCSSPCLRHEEFCYYHHATRRPLANPKERKARLSAFHLPNPEDRGAIQMAIGEVLQRIAANEIDPKRAGLLLYGLQIASLNLPRQRPTAQTPPTVVEVVADPPSVLSPPPAKWAKTKTKWVLPSACSSNSSASSPATPSRPSKPPPKNWQLVTHDWEPITRT